MISCIGNALMPGGVTQTRKSISRVMSQGKLGTIIHIGVVTELFDQVKLNPDRTLVMMCGPEIMMRVASNALSRRGLRPNQMYVSLERHMECGIGLCGHCQLGQFFLCKDSPVMRLDTIMPLVGKSGI